MGVKFSKQIQKLEQEIHDLKKEMNQTKYHLHLAKAIKSENLVYSLAKKIARQQDDLSYKERELASIKERESEQGKDRQLDS